MGRMSSVPVVHDPATLDAVVRYITDVQRSSAVVLLTMRDGDIAPPLQVPTIHKTHPTAVISIVQPHVLDRLSTALGTSLPSRSAIVLHPGQVSATPITGSKTDMARQLIAALDATAARPVTASPMAAPAPPAAATPTNTAPGPRHDVQRAETPLDAAALAARLLDQARAFPVVVVGTPRGADEPWIDADSIAEACRDRAEVWVIRTGAPSWRFKDELPAGTDLFGSAARVYPADTAWLLDPFLSRLYLCPRPEVAGAVQRATTSEALRLAAPRSHITAAHSHDTYRNVSGVVQGIVGERVLVKTTTGEMAAVWPERLVAGLPADRLFTKGMQVDGLLDVDANRIDVDEMVLSAADALAHYGPGDVVLGRARAVEADLCVLELFPDFEVSLSVSDIAITSVSLDVRTLIVEGEVVRARIVARAESDDAWTLSLLDVDPESDELLDAPPYLRGGPSWLCENPGDPADEPPVYEGRSSTGDAPSPPPPLPPQPGHIPARASHTPTNDPDRIAELEQENRTLQIETADLSYRLKQANQQLQKATRERRLAEQSVKRRSQMVGAVVDVSNRFRDAGEQLRFEVYLAWATSTTPDDKDAYPWRDDWTLSPDFLASLATVQAARPSRLADVMCDIIVGRGGHTEHPLRSGPGGDDPQRERADGGKAYRAYLKSHSPGAPRLHFWRLPGSRIEFASVRLHDDMRT